MTSLPPPSHLVLLQDLPSVPDGTKVRFLGCVSGYDAPAAVLHLRSASARPAASVDTALLSATLRAADAAPGAWVNVIGYVGRAPLPLPQAARPSRPSSASPSPPTPPPPSSESSSQPIPFEELRGVPATAGAGGQARPPAAAAGTGVRVQALMVWSAGAVDAQAYERAAARRIGLDRAVREAAPLGGGGAEGAG